MLRRAKHQRKYYFWPVCLEHLIDSIFFRWTTKLCNAFHQTVEPANHECLLGRVTFLIVKYPFQLEAQKSLIPVLQQTSETTSVLLGKPFMKIKPQPINLHSWNEKHMLDDMQTCDWLLMEITDTSGFGRSPCYLLCSTKSSDRTEIFTISKQRANLKHFIGLVFLILEGNIFSRCPRVIPYLSLALPGSGSQELWGTLATAEVSCEAKHLPRVASPSKNLLSSSFFLS